MVVKCREMKCKKGTGSGNDCKLRGPARETRGTEREMKGKGTRMKGKRREMKDSEGEMKAKRDVGGA